MSTTNHYNRLDVAKLANLPEELRSGKRFVCWCEEVRDGEPTKVPINPHNGRKAKPNDPATWATLDQAVAYYLAHQDSLYGVGRMLHADDEIIGFDLDSSLDEDRNLITEHPAAKWLPLLDTCTEVSPSGTGVKGFVHAKHDLGGKAGRSKKFGKRGNAKKPMAVEMYRKCRFFAVTGEVLPRYSAKVEYRQEQIDAMYREYFPEKEPTTTGTGTAAPPVVDSTDAEVIDRAKHARNGNKFSALFSGNWKPYYPSQSEADAALAAILWFQTGDRDAVRRIFGLSGLARPKWKKRTDYQEQTLDLACHGEVYSPRNESTSQSSKVVSIDGTAARDGEQVRSPKPNGTEPSNDGSGHSSGPATTSCDSSEPPPTTTPLTAEEAATLTCDLLEICFKWILRFVVLADAEAIILAFWLLHCWAFDAAVTTPYIHVRSPEKESGKTTLMKVLKAVARFPRFCSSISPAALARVVGKDKPSLFLDELDAQMKGDHERAQDIRGVLDSGYEIDGNYTRCMGKNHEVVNFPTFCPKVLAGIGELWDTVESRSIHIEMRRRLPHETVEALRTRRIQNDATPIREALQGWQNGKVVDLLNQIEVADVPELGNRQMDISEPLLQIAQLAGNGWPAKLLKALRDIFGHKSTEDDGSTSVLLLYDIRDIFAKPERDEIPSRDMVAALNEIEGRPWAEWSKGRGLSPNNLARLLKKYHIYPTNLRVRVNVPKGYRRVDFEDAWERYCSHPKTTSPPSSPPNSTATPLQAASSLNETPFSNRYTTPDVADRKSAPNPHEHRIVAAVAVQKPGDAKKDDFEPLTSSSDADNKPHPNGHASQDHRGPEAEHDRLVGEVVRVVESGQALDDDQILACLPGRRREDILKAIQSAIDQGLIGSEGGSDA
jgi:hypothetical protein